jgi:hypothetical protein
MNSTDEKEKIVYLQCHNKKTAIWLIIMTSPDIPEANSILAKARPHFDRWQYNCIREAFSTIRSEFECRTRLQDEALRQQVIFYATALLRLLLKICVQREREK